MNISKKKKKIALGNRCAESNLVVLNLHGQAGPLGTFSYSGTPGFKNGS